MRPDLENKIERLIIHKSSFTPDYRKTSSNHQFNKISGRNGHTLPVLFFFKIKASKLSH